MPMSARPAVLRTGLILLSLTAESYQFPDATDRWDANWLQVALHAEDPEGAWDAVRPALLTWEVGQLAGWLRAVAEQPTVADEGIAFLEPYLWFRWEPGALLVTLDDGFAPPWKPAEDTHGYELRLDVPPERLGLFADELESWREDFPERATAEKTPPTSAVVRERVRVGWDFTLMMATVALLAALGAQSLVGTLYVWWAQRTIAGWLQGPGYGAYVALMDTIAAPLVAGLVVVLGLCVPKRLFERRTLVAVSAGLVTIGIVWGLVQRSLQEGMAAYLIAAAGLQAVVVALTVSRSGGVTFLTEGRGRRLGSALLHLGFIVFCFVVVALQDASPALMLPVFAVSALLLGAGSAMSFYARR
jgi:hypothetical protein